MARGAAFGASPPLRGGAEVVVAGGAEVMFAATAGAGEEYKAMEREQGESREDEPGGDAQAAETDGDLGVGEMIVGEAEEGGVHCGRRQGILEYILADAQLMGLGFEKTGELDGIETVLNALNCVLYLVIWRAASQV